jgi:hypothetical protein
MPIFDVRDEKTGFFDSVYALDEDDARERVSKRIIHHLAVLSKQRASLDLKIEALGNVAVRDLSIQRTDV